jgi:hypothetical protein
MALSPSILMMAAADKLMERLAKAKPEPREQK